MHSLTRVATFSETETGTKIGRSDPFNLAIANFVAELELDILVFPFFGVSLY